MIYHIQYVGVRRIRQCFLINFSQWCLAFFWTSFSSKFVSWISSYEATISPMGWRAFVFCTSIYLFLKMFWLAGILFSRFYLFIFREGGGREKERDRNVDGWLPLMHPLLGTWSATQACALTENRTNDPLLYRMALSLLSHTAKAFSILLIYRKKNLLMVFRDLFYQALCMTLEI